MPLLALIKASKERKITKTNLITFLEQNGITLLTFSLLFVYLCQYHSPSYFNEWDEFSHWGDMIKGMFASNRLYCYLEIKNYHPDYPPLFQCIEWLFCHLSKAYSEVSCYRAVSTFSISLLFPVLIGIENIDIKRQIKRAALFVVIVLLLISIDYTWLHSILNSICLDMPIGIMAGSTAFLIISDIEDNKIAISLLLVSILLTKEIGLAFYLALIVLIVVVNIINKNREGLIKKTILYVVIPLAFFAAWKIYTSRISGQFSLSSIKMTDVFNIVFNNIGEQWLLQVKDKFFKYIFIEPILNVGISYCSFFQISLLILFVLFLYFENRKSDIKKASLIIFGILVGIFGFIATMLILYLSCFNKTETLALASFARYFGTFVCYLITLTVLLLFYKLINCNGDNTKQMLCIMVALMFFSNVKLINLIKNNHTTDLTDTYEFRLFKKQIENNCDGECEVLIVGTDYYDHIANYNYTLDKYKSFSTHYVKDQYHKDESFNTYYKGYNY